MKLKDMLVDGFICWGLHQLGFSIEDYDRLQGNFSTNQYKVGKTTINLPPNHHSYRRYALIIPKWVVDDIALPT